MLEELSLDGVADRKDYWGQQDEEEVLVGQAHILADTLSKLTFTILKMRALAKPNTIATVDSWRKGQLLLAMK